MPTRKIKTSPVKVTGRAPEGQEFESHLEEDFFVLLRFNKNVVQWESHPLTIEWLDAQGKVREYTPDVLVEYRPEKPGADPVVVLCEIKPDFDGTSDRPKNRLPRRESEAENKLKWDAAERYAARKGWTFKVYREADIRTPYLRNARFLMRFRERPVSMHRHQELMDTLKAHTKLSLEDWVNPLVSTKAQRADLLPTCYHLITEGYVKVDLSTLISLKSVCEYIDE